MNFFISFIVFCSLDALKKASKEKQTRIKMKIVDPAGKYWSPGRPKAVPLQRPQDVP